MKAQKEKCVNCGEKYDSSKATWSAGYGCKYYCSKECCNAHALTTNTPIPTCPCY